MNVLGLSAWGDGAAALVRDGRVTAVAEGAAGFPSPAAALCLERGEVSAAHLDAIAWAEKPLQAVDRLLSTSLAYAPSGWERFADNARRLAPTLPLGLRLRRDLGFSGTLLFVETTEALAEAAFLEAPLEHAALLVAGAGAEWADCALGRGRDAAVELSVQNDFPHSLSALWEAFSHYLGAAPAVIAERALAGAPGHSGALAELVDLKDDGSFHLDLGYFDHCARRAPTNARFHALFGREPLPARAPWGRREADIAASLQSLTEEALRRMARQARRLSGAEPICLAGSMALNRPAMARLRAESPAGFFAAASADAAQRAAGAALVGWQKASQGLPPKESPFSGALRLAAPGESVPRPGVASAGKLCGDALLATAYFLALTPYSLPLRLLGFEFLDERFSSETFWRPRRLEGEGLRAYRRRF